MVNYSIITYNFENESGKGPRFSWQMLKQPKENFTCCYRHYFHHTSYPVLCLCHAQGVFWFSDNSSNPKRLASPYICLCYSFPLDFDCPSIIQNTILVKKYYRARWDIQRIRRKRIEKSDIEIDIRNGAGNMQGVLGY